MNKGNNEIDKIDVEELMQDFKIQDVEAFQIYLKELWKDLSQRSDDKGKGINLVTFNQYYDIPGIILDRLFDVMDKNKNSYLDLNEFSDGMVLLFTSSFDSLVQFIFKFYDFDNDGLITKEDIRTVLSYVPINSANKYRKDKLRYESQDFKDRMESQDELILILNACFSKLTQIDLKTFVDIIENKCSEVFLYLVIFLLEKRPFNKKTLLAYNSLKKNPNSNLKSPSEAKRLIASPKLESKFSPSLTLAKSPSMNKRTPLGGNTGGPGNSMLNKITGKTGEDPKSKLMQYALGNKQSSEITDDNSGKNPIRKKMHNLKNLEDIKQEKVEKMSSNNKLIDGKSPQMGLARKYENQGVQGLSQVPVFDDEDDDGEDIKNEGFLYKITNNKKLKKLWFKQIDKDLYCKYKI